MTHPVWPGMRDRKFGRIITISSINGQKGQFAQVNYAVSKAGDLGMTKSLAHEDARMGITANAICPGYISTDMVMALPEKVRESIVTQIPTGRLGTPEEIARCVYFWLRTTPDLSTAPPSAQTGGSFSSENSHFAAIRLLDARKAGVTGPAFLEYVQTAALRPEVKNSTIPCLIMRI